MKVPKEPDETDYDKYSSKFRNNNNLRNKVMSNTADGYSLFSWSNSFVKKEDTVISMHRSVALGKANTLSTTFLYYVHSQVGDLYSYQLKKRINESNGIHIKI